MPFPSSKGWMVINQRWAIPAFRTGSRFCLVLNQSIKTSISWFNKTASGAWKCTFSLPNHPETTCMIPECHAPTAIGYIPLLPVGKSAACQLNKRSLVKSLWLFCVASSIISTMPSTFVFEGTNPIISIPKRLAKDERTCTTFKNSPSISVDFKTSSGF